MAIKAGYRHLDGAQMYGNEKHLGDAVKQSGLPREDFYITTKLDGSGEKGVKDSFEESLAKLGMEYVDQYLIHDPFWAKDKSDLQRVWAELEEIQASGKAKSIGVSNFLIKDLEAILETSKVTPAINQIEYHPYLQHKTDTEDLLAFHKAHGIATAAYGPLSALLFGKPGPLDQYYVNLATKYNVSPADVALKWSVQQDVVTITTSGNEERLKGYLKNIPEEAWELREREIDNIAEIGKEKHYRRFWGNKFETDDRR
jgi:diketogulonate reductase-like aldo/keto reductase